MIKHKILFSILFGGGCLGFAGAFCCLADDMEREIFNKFL